MASPNPTKAVTSPDVRRTRKVLVLSTPASLGSTAAQPQRTAMSADHVMDEDEQYASSEDSDFASDTAPAPVSDASDSEPEPEQAGTKRRPAKAKAKEPGADEAGYDNSGDEAIIEKGRKRRRRARDKGVDEYEEGGEGGLVKTRRQRAAEYVSSTYAQSSLV